ncbi:hypothetical protein ACIRPQ_08630 [Streptomyces sp. NPDC101213]|uniref:hypothetical protein n=1 Tax=unclassified Streptomyces TaxID=2593676 RepID=UPI0036FBC109
MDAGVDADMDAGDEEGFAEETTAPDGTPPGARLVPSASPRAAGRTEAAEERPVGRMLRILPLGSGLVLIGMGLGLGLLGLRLRRG